MIIMIIHSNSNNNNNNNNNDNNNSSRCLGDHSFPTHCHYLRLRAPELVTCVTLIVIMMIVLNSNSIRST